MQLKQYKLSDVAHVEISGVDKKTNNGEQPVKLCNFTDVYRNWAITKNIRDSFMDASATPNEIRRFKLKKGKVAFTKDSETRYDIGIPTYIADDFDDVILGYHCALITPDENKVSGAYINAFMHTSLIKDYFANNATGSGQRYSLSVDAMENMPLFLPSLDEQKRIASLLSNIDRKIALNRQINTNLEALARQLYDYWFVQFDFPDANGKPYKSSGGKMVYNPQLKREIPKDWEMKKIGDILGRVKTTPKLVTDEYLEKGKYPIIDQTSDVYFAGFTDREDAILDQYPVVVFGDHSCAVKYINFPFVRGADGTQILLPNDNKISTEYLYFAVNDIRIVKGYARHFSFLKESLVIVPEQSVASAFKDMAQNWFKSITQHRLESLSLTRQRDELLPLLMNGQVTVE